MLKRLRKVSLSIEAGLAVVYLSISLILRILVFFFRFKLRIWKRKIRFRNALKENQFDEEYATKLSDELPEISLMSIISELREG